MLMVSYSAVLYILNSFQNNVLLFMGAPNTISNNKAVCPLRVGWSGVVGGIRCNTIQCNSFYWVLQHSNSTTIGLHYSHLGVVLYKQTFVYCLFVLGNEE